MKLRNVKLMLLMAVAMVIGIATTSCKHTEVNEFISTLNLYSQSIENVNTLEEFNEQNNQFNKAMEKFSKSTASIDQADREAILKAIDKFSGSVNKSMSRLLGVALMTDEQRAEEIQTLAKDFANAKTLGAITQICLTE